MTGTRFQFDTLDPYDPASIQRLIDFHKATFGGWVMKEGDGAEGDKGGDGDKDGKPADGDAGDKGDGFKSEGSKQAVLADLAKERDARQALQKQVDELAPLKDLAAAINGGKQKDDDKGATPEDAIKAVNDLRDELAVERLARANGITDEKDIAILLGTKADARSDLAARLKPGTTTGTPKPDPSAGRGSGGDGKATSVATGRALYEERHGKKTT